MPGRLALLALCWPCLVMGIAPNFPVADVETHSVVLKSAKMSLQKGRVRARPAQGWDLGLGARARHGVAAVVVSSALFEKLEVGSGHCGLASENIDPTQANEREVLFFRRLALDWHGVHKAASHPGTLRNSVKYSAELKNYSPLNSPKCVV